MAHYSILKPITESEGYGIKIVTEENFRDISYNYAAVSELCNRCNELDVCPVHFRTILEDFLSRKEDF